MYPLTQPHGASRSGLLTFSPVTITSANRVELPVETGVMKLLDLDRCYSVSRIPTNGSKELILYNLHLSAYTSDGTIATQQLKLLLADMQAEYEAGNWCVAGGDFNKDLLGDSAYYLARRIRRIPGHSPSRRAHLITMISHWWLRWMNPLPSPAAATRTVPITRDNTS